MIVHAKPQRHTNSSSLRMRVPVVNVSSDEPPMLNRLTDFLPERPKVINFWCYLSFMPMARACAARQAKQNSSTVSTSCWISSPKHYSAQVKKRSEGGNR
jgi:hypothetical protein